MGFISSDIQVVANTSFAAQNPAAVMLFEVVGFPLTDIAIQNWIMSQGENSEEDIDSHAAAWIADHRGVIDTWLDAARRAADS